MEEFNRKHRALKCFPLRTLHQNNNNVISKRKRNTQENGECTLKRLKNCHFDNGKWRISIALNFFNLSYLVFFFTFSNHHGLRYYWRKEGYKYEVYFLQEVVWLPWRYCSSLICFCLSLLLMPTTNSTDFEDFAWHVSQAHGIPAQVAKCIMNKLVVSFSSLLLPPFFGLANFCWGTADNCCCFFFTSLKLSKGRGKIEDSENAVGIHKFLDTHYECIPQVVWDAQDVSDCE